MKRTVQAQKKPKKMATVEAIIGAIFGVLVLLGFFGFLLFGFGYHVARPVAKGVAIGARAIAKAARARKVAPSFGAYAYA